MADFQIEVSRPAERQRLSVNTLSIRPTVSARRHSRRSDFSEHRAADNLDKQLCLK